VILSRQKRLSGLIIIFFLVVYTAAIIFNTPYHDTLYYWNWSRHLGLSYYDGPPMIAYFFKIATTLLGNSEWAINTFSVLCNLGIAALIYFLSLNLFDHRVARWSAIIWLLNPTVFVQYVALLEYDTPTTLFWMATLLTFYLAHKNKTNGYLYLSGVFLGCTLLSKYTGVLLYLALFLMVLSVKPYRYLLKNIHLYLALVVSILLFSPVLIWNYQHGFDSFIYQSQHGLKHPFAPLGAWADFKQTLGAYNVIFLLLLFYVIRYWKIIHADERFALLFYPAMVSVLFFTLLAPFQHKSNWNETFLMSGTIMVVYFSLQSSWSRRVLIITSFAYALGVMLILTAFMSQGKFGFSKRMSTLDSKINSLAINQVYDQKMIVFADSWQTASSMSFYLKEHPQVYSVSPQANQYRYWSRAMTERLRNGKVPEVLFVAQNLNPPSLVNYSMHCRLTLVADHGPHPLYAYLCRPI
jgi:4-amino-4-deoxy-L-arabinose transferase-like glycosyltransferase